MSLFGVSEAVWWAILALGGVAATTIGRRGHHLAVVGVYFVACVVFVLYEIERRSVPVGQGEGIAILMMAGLMTLVAMVPMLLVAGHVSVAGGIVCGFVGATMAAYGFPLIYLTLAHRVPIEQRHCNLPTLEASIPSTTLAEIGTMGFLSARCPVPLPTELEFERSYGVIGMRWGTASHRLYAFGRTADGQPLTIGGDRFDEIVSPQRSPSPEYSHVRNFGQTRYHGDPPGTQTTVRPQTFFLAVSRADGQILEEIEFTYGSRPCTCAYYLYLGHGGYKLP